MVGFEAYPGIGSLAVIVVGSTAFGCSCVVVGNVVVCLLVCFFLGEIGRAHV